MFRHCSIIPLLFALPTMTNALFSNCEKDGDLKSRKKRKKLHVWNNDWDMMSENASLSAIPKAEQPSRQIVLIRHGQYVEKPVKDINLTSSDCSHDSQQVLTELGRKQATLTGMRLKELLESEILYPIDTVYYSTMARATETCGLILSAMSSSTVDEKAVLSQGVPSILQPHQVKACSMITEGAVHAPSPPYANWPVSERNFHLGNTRVEAAFANYFNRADPETKTANYSTVFVCHGNVIRYLVMRALQFPPEAWSRLAVYNASVTILEIYPSGKVSLRALGEVGHLPAECISYSQSDAPKKK